MRTILAFSFPGQPIPFLDYMNSNYEVLKCSHIDDLHDLIKLNRIEILCYVSSERTDVFSEILAIPELTNVPSIVFAKDELMGNRLNILKNGSDFLLPVDVTLEEFSSCMNRIDTSLMRIEVLAYRDALTSAYNRRFFELIMTFEFAKARSNKSPLSLSLLDIDRFKQINDTYGHSFGDEVLKGLVSFLETEKREQDFLIRLGGEEFVLVLPDTEVAAAAEIVNGILNNLNITPVAMKDSNPFFITFSAGVVAWRPGTSLSDLLKRVDEKLYVAKQNGRNRIEGIEGKVIINPLENSSILINCQNAENRKRYQQLFGGKVNYLHLSETFTDMNRQVESQHFDLIIVEEYTGKSFYEGKLKTSEGYVIPMMMVFAQKAPDLIEVINAGVNDFIIQPYNLDEIYHKACLLYESKKREP